MTLELASHVIGKLLPLAVGALVLVILVELGQRRVKSLAVKSACWKGVLPCLLLVAVVGLTGLDAASWGVLRMAWQGIAEPAHESISTSPVAADASSRLASADSRPSSDDSRFTRAGSRHTNAAGLALWLLERGFAEARTRIEEHLETDSSRSAIREPHIAQAEKIPREATANRINPFETDLRSSELESTRWLPGFAELPTWEQTDQGEVAQEPAAVLAAVAGADAPADARPESAGRMGHAISYLYVALVSVTLMLLVVAMVRRVLVWGICQLSSSVHDPDLLRRLGQLLRAMNWSRRVTLFESKYLSTPVSCGLTRPLIGVPCQFVQRFHSLERDVMLAHELGHLRNRDPLWLFVADLVVALWWWHPAVWFARRRLESACEFAADDAAALVPGGRLVLAECLVRLGRNIVSRRRSLTPGWLSVRGGTYHSELGRRVQRLVSRDNDPPGTNVSEKRGRTRFVLAIAFLAMSMLACGVSGSMSLANTGDKHMGMFERTFRNSAAGWLMIAVLGSTSTSVSQETPPPEEKVSDPAQVEADYELAIQNEMEELIKAVEEQDRRLGDEKLRQEQLERFKQRITQISDELRAESADAKEAADAKESAAVDEARAAAMQEARDLRLAVIKNLKAQLMAMQHEDDVLQDEFRATQKLSHDDELARRKNVDSELAAIKEKLQQVENEIGELTAAAKLNPDNPDLRTRLDERGLVAQELKEALLRRAAAQEGDLYKAETGSDAETQVLKMLVDAVNKGKVEQARMILRKYAKHAQSSEASPGEDAAWRANEKEKFANRLRDRLTRSDLKAREQVDADSFPDAMDRIHRLEQSVEDTQRMMKEMHEQMMQMRKLLEDRDDNEEKDPLENASR